MNHDKYREYYNSLPWYIRLRNEVYYWLDIKFNKGRELAKAHERLNEWFI